MRLSLRRALAMARKEVIQLRRDPRSLGMAFVVPAAMIVFFGYVISFNVKDIRLAILDQDRSQHSEQLVDAFVASGWFEIASRIDEYAAVDDLMLRGAVRIVMVIPPGFQKEIAAGRMAPVQAIVDGADANTAAIALNYASAIASAWSARLTGRTMTSMVPIQTQSRVWYNETLKTSNMIVPGLVAVIMMIISAMLTALTIAREWERGTMEQLAATPVHRVEVILGKLLYLAIGLIDVVGAIIIGRIVFHVPFRGSVTLLFMMTTLFLIGAMGLGIFISASLKSQLLATQTAMMATYLPSILLSGLMFDIASMPVALRVISNIVPATYFIVVLRGIFLKGVGFGVLWTQAVAMVIFAVVGLTLAVRAFRKEIA